MSEESDLKSIEEILRGNHTAFGDLYDRYARLVRCLCYEATFNMHDANDLTQEVFLVAFRRLATLRNPERFRYWLLEITRNVVHDFHRKNKRGALTSMDDIGEPVAQDTYDPQPHAELRSMIARLPETERMALHLYYLDGQPVAAAKQVLSLSQSGFYKVLDRARALLQQMLIRTQQEDRQ